MIKEVKYRGVTTTPSDYESTDGDLATSSNVVVDGDKLVVTKEPVQAYPASGLLGKKPLFIHNTTDNNTFYILLGNNLSGSNLYYRNSVGSEDRIAGAPNQEPKKIDAIGNTLIVIYDDGSIHYIIYKNGGYEYKGTHIPTVELQFGLAGSMVRLAPKDVQFPDGSFDGQEQADNTINDGFIDSVTQRVFGEVEMFMRDEGANKGRFGSSFFVRYALKLYDGSYTCISAPIYMDMNKGTVPAVGYWARQGGRTAGFSVYNTFARLYTRLISSASVLNGWEDIVSSIDIFVSSPMQTVDPFGKLEKTIPFNGQNVDADHVFTNGFSTIEWLFSPGSTVGNVYATIKSSTAFAKYISTQVQSEQYPRYVFQLPYLTAEQSDDNVKASSLFYKVYSYKLSTINGNYGNEKLDTARDIEIPITSEILNALETQKTLTDDYYSNDSIKSKSSFVYNGRLTIANIERGAFDGWSPASLLPRLRKTNNINPLYFVTASVKYHFIINENGVRMHVSSAQSTNLNIQTDDESNPQKYYGLTPEYAFYPNPNATDLIIEAVIGGTTYYITKKMEPCPTLNGAVCVMTDGIDSSEFVTTPIPQDLSILTDTVPYPSQIYTSETYNPYVFKAENVNQLPMSADIINIASTTQPMSQGQFGQFPLYVFSDAGIFALQLASNGSFSTLTPVTRDVILGDGSSLTQLDDSILFATKQGIMELVGKKTRCLTDKLDKKLSIPNLGNDLYAIIGTGTTPVVPDIKTFVNGCQMVYDYIHARVIVFKEGSNYVYVYSAKDDSWTLMPIAGLIDTINSYPDAYAVKSATVNNTLQYSIVDLATIIDENGVGGTANSGWFITRPIDLDAPNDFKLIDVVRQNGVFEEYLIKNEQELYEGKSAMNDGHTVIEQILYGSNDLINWFVIGSSDSRLINGRTSAGFKWFRLAVKSTLKPGESISSVTFSYRIKAENPHLF